MSDDGVRALVRRGQLVADVHTAGRMFVNLTEVERYKAEQRQRRLRHATRQQPAGATTTAPAAATTTPAAVLKRSRAAYDELNRRLPQRKGAAS
jgi:hypothetical protein